MRSRRWAVRTPAESQPDYGKGDKSAVMPLGDPEDVAGGTGFNDAREIGQGVWRDRILPSQTRWYKVPVGWGQQLRYDVEFANEPTVERAPGTSGASGNWSYGATDVFTPARAPVGGGSTEFGQRTVYDGRPAALKMGTVPVSWTNRYEHHPDVIPVHQDGAYYIAATLGSRAAEIAENPQVGVVLRVAVLGEAKSGPQYGAPVAVMKPATRADGAGTGGAGWTGTMTAMVAGGAAVLIAGIVSALVRTRAARGGNSRTDTTWGRAR
ncbi:hypothetical protein ABZ532_11170 [Streptomyces sp. NPDC019396]|uniref:hypothetical protein n=1 Tax=Streptomyces sp. NPDC019396 TaxID=3154687 RepID=UPI0033E96E6F